jgi:hypothetical protein
VSGARCTTNVGTENEVIHGGKYNLLAPDWVGQQLAKGHSLGLTQPFPDLTEDWWHRRIVF